MEKVIMQTSHTATGFCCICEQLPGWVVTGSKDFGKFKEYVQESIDLYIECAKEDGESYPSVFDGEYEVVYDMDACALLSYYQKIISFAGLQSLSGINQRQLAHYVAGRSKPRPQQAEKIKQAFSVLAQDILKGYKN